MNKRIFTISSIWMAIFFACCSSDPGNSVQQFVCPPCSSECDKLLFKAAGKCPHCGMTLILQDTTQNDTLINVAILIFDGVEVLDFGGPSEVFASTDGFRVFTVAANNNAIDCQGFIKIQPGFDLENCPRPDIIVIPGGNMSAPLGDPKVIEWVKTTETHAEVVLSVCTGAFVLEKAGLLKDKKATTFHDAIEELRKIATQTEVLDHVRWVDNGKIITTAGVSAGIDGALRVVERYKGREKALLTVRYMEYDKWNPDEGLIVAPKEAKLKQ